MEELLAKHRKEQKDLQARITQKKKSATKKTRRGINEECDRLQSELSERHQAEIAELNGEPTPPIDDLDDLSLNGSEEDKTQKDQTDGSQNPPSIDNSPDTSSAASEASTPSPRPKKPNRQKARLARRAAEQAAQSAIAAEEAAKQTDYRGDEQEVMDGVFKRLGLKQVEIKPDGHCLYSAIAYQLEMLGLGLKPDPKRIVLETPTQSRIDTVASPQHDGYRAVRAVTADFINEHQDDFVPFMEEPVELYTRKIKLTAEWGGQLELLAIAKAYGVEINIIQGDGRIEKIEGDTQEYDDEQKSKRIIWLAYYRHTYGLGEHYNALMK
ncbi:hypothetical protein BDV38DRAFT_248962 [Aspergillus pseudotamarii]|uniref:OTU domain-containing protein n=1 Tax=Aspergillus pseudotamarii TaxID=132259 RepID=A0A5N6SPU0_ASPPS|nr:uncharacterized protein BDV38DRAFT_248962 [Aspergillus pseudotamarii]KAE8136716.1 hypothetical protein BDV38DRAFT_248962 [Aspergillus pseudotamarii]